jgi:hypothetical protein
MYIRRLPGKKGVLLDKNNIPQNHVFFNPSADGPYVYIRATRHTRVDETNYVIIHNDITKTVHTIESPMDKLAPTANLFQGIEDLRIVCYHDRVWFSGTCTHASDHMTNELVVGHFDQALTKVERISVVDIGSRPVKNVCPFVWKDKLHLLDAYLRVIYLLEEEVDENTNKFQRFVATKVKDITSAQGVPNKGFRGSTSPVHLHGNTWGFIVHDIIFNDNSTLVTRLAYYHHWVEMDMERGVVTYFSSPFWCSHWGIEYISGIRYNKETSEVELFMGVQDNTPVKCVTTLADLRAGK